MSEIHPSDAPDNWARVANAVILSSAESDLDGALIFYCNRGSPPPVLEVQISGDQPLWIDPASLLLFDNGIHKAAIPGLASFATVERFLRKEGSDIPPRKSAAFLRTQAPWTDPFIMDFFKSALSIEVQIVPYAIGSGFVAGLRNEDSDQDALNAELLRGIDEALVGKTLRFSARGSSAALSDLEQTCGFRPR